MTDSIDDIEYDARISINYHRKRERFFRGFDASSKAVSLIALASIGFEVSPFTVTAAVISGLFTIATIVLDCSGMAAKHGSLAAQFSSFMAKVAMNNGEPDVKSLRREYHIISAEEPPQLRGLAQVCQDEQDAAIGKHVDSSRLSPWRRVIAQFGFGDRPIDYV